MLTGGRQCCLPEGEHNVQLDAKRSALRVVPDLRMLSRYIAQL